MINELLAWKNLIKIESYSFKYVGYQVLFYLFTTLTFTTFSIFILNKIFYLTALPILIASILSTSYAIYNSSKLQYPIFISISETKIRNYYLMYVYYLLFLCIVIISIIIFVMKSFDDNLLLVFTLGIIYLNIFIPVVFSKKIIKEFLISLVLIIFIALINKEIYNKFFYNDFKFIIVLIIIALISFIYSSIRIRNIIRPKNYTK